MNNYYYALIFNYSYIYFVLDSHKRTIQLLGNTTSINNRKVYGSKCIGDESRLTECLVDFRYCEPSDEQPTVKCIPIGRYML